MTDYGLKNLKGRRFGRLRVIKRAGSNKHRRAVWLCECSCGTRKKITGNDLLMGTTKSCGCYLRSHPPALVHGHTRNYTKSLEYSSYENAKYRCQNPNTDRYADYGGRGIKFLFTSFIQFLACVGPRPTPKHSLDRIRVNGHYKPGNVRWATAKEQGQNKRRKK